MLAENGVLSFILPKNFLSCSYYNKTREYIYRHFNIIHIEECSGDSYIDTEQPTIIFIVQKKSPLVNNNFTIEPLLPNYTIFNTPPNICKLNELYSGSTTLHKLECSVSVGKVVWNQCKDILTDDTTKTRLIYSSDIKNGNLIMANFKNPKKKNYINKTGVNKMVLIINRGYGNGKYIFNCCIVDINEKYLLENHVIAVKHKKNISHGELKELYNKIIKSLNNTKTKEFISLYIGNSALNTTELNHILPIYL